jgi:adhesin/invasin
MVFLRSDKESSAARFSAPKVLWAGAVLLLAFSYGCDHGSGPPPSPSSLEAVAGVDQTATVGEAVAVVPAVGVFDTKGRPISGREVIFSVTSGGGFVSEAVQITDVDGVARVGGWTLGTAAGANTLQASVPELLPLSFAATAVAGPPATIIVQQGETQDGVVGSDAPVAPSVLVRDEFHNPVAGASVEFEVLSGGGSVSEGSALTDDSGIARAGAWTLGTIPGTNTLSASLTGLEPVTFEAETIADQPEQISVLQGDQQTGTVGTELPLPPSLRVADRFGNLLEGVPVFFQVVSGSGNLEGEAQITDEAGVATAGTWTLGTDAGTQTVTATVHNVDPVTLTATATPGAPAESSAATEDAQTATAGTAVPLPPSVLVSDAFGNPVPGISVTFAETGVPAPSSGGGTPPSGPNATTGPDGIAAVESWVLGTIAGEYQLSAFVSGIAEPVVFGATAVPDLPINVTKAQGDNQTAQIGLGVGIPPAITVQDQYGNGVEGVIVEFSVADGGGAISGSSATTDVAGWAAVGSWILGAVPGVNSLAGTAVGVGSVTFDATGLTAIPAAISTVAGDAQTAQVGTTVAIPPQVRITDASGEPVSWVTVEFSVVSGGGTVTEESIITDAGGLASVGSWTLGTAAGTQSLQAMTEGIGPVLFSATASPGSPAGVTVGAGVGQSATTSTAVPVSPSVFLRDTYGNGVPGVPVAFGATLGDGAVSGSPATTNSNGEATVGSWVLGPTPGLNELTATVAGVGSVSIQATGVAAVPSAITKVAGDNQTTEVGTAVGLSPQVRVTDSGGNPIPAIEVLFWVSLGGGTVNGATAVTDVDGLASVGGWVLGTDAGVNTLDAAPTGLAPVTFTATGTPGSPATMVVNGGDGQTAQTGSAVPLPPSVLVQDAHGNGVSGVSVAFAATAGGGSITGSPALTNASGVARVGSWTLGPSPGPNELTATSGGLSSTAFSASGISAGGFSLELQFMTAMDPTQEAVFSEAAARWEEVIAGDIPDFVSTLPAGGCQPVEESGGVDDVKIYVTVSPIDGPGGILGRAGPCYIWNPGNAFPITGIIELDSADVAGMQANGMLKDVIIHEMGHVLGIGTLWNAYANDFLIGSGTSDPYFNGPAAIAAFDAAGGDVRPDPKVPVENTGGSGTRDSHWRESVHNAELMTGWIEPGGTPNPLSAITIASLADIGYSVNIGVADPYTLFNPLGAPSQGPPPNLIYIKELPPPVPIPINPGGGG